MSMAYALTDSRVMVTRCVRRSLRDPEAFFTALMLPVVLMLLFVYVFGGAFDGSGAYVDYVVPGLIVLCAGFGAGTTAVAVATDMSNGIVDRFRSMPISGSLVLVGHVVASLIQTLVPFSPRLRNHAIQREDEVILGALTYFKSRDLLAGMVDLVFARRVGRERRSRRVRP